MRRTRLVLSVSLLLLTMIGGGCGDDDDCCIIEPPPVDRSAEPAYAGAGPYAVGVTQMALADRKVEVFYPASAGSEVGQPLATYRQSDPFDPVMASLVEGLARQQRVDLTYTMAAYRDLPVAAGRFPVIVFSHGFGGWRLVNSSLLAGMASWGFVVTSADHIERDLAAVASNTARPNALTDRRVLLEQVELMKTADAEIGGPFAGRIDTEHFAAAGHSAGGAAALSVLDAPEFDAIIGYASVGAVNAQVDKPTLLVVANGDIVVTPSFTQGLYQLLRSPKVFAAIERSGHNSFTDSCDAIRNGASLTQLARAAGFPIDENLLRLGENGCTDAEVDPSEVWAITQHLTVAVLRHAFGLDPVPVGLAPAVGERFATPVTLRSE